jgi:heptosyltransferase-2
MPVKLLRTIDKYIIWFLIIILFWLKYFFIWKKDKLIKKPKTILVIRVWALWSSLLTFPMIKQLEDFYGKWVQYDLLASSRNIWVFKNQWYFKNMYNLFNIKHLFKLICSFKKYDIVIDTEEYFMISAFMSLWSWKINCWFTNIKVRRLAYNNWIIYNDKQHSVLTCLDLLKSIWIDYKIPDALEPLKYTDKDKIKVDEFLKWLKYSKLICMHTWLAETSKDRARPKNKWIELIQKVINNDNEVKIILSWSKWEYDSVQEIYTALAEKHQKNVINICWMFSLFWFAYLLEKCDLMVSNDTWPMHLAAAMWTRTIWLFWPNLPERFGPYPLDKNVWIYKWDWNASINVHLGKFKEDKNYNIDKIQVDDVLKCLF